MSKLDRYKGCLLGLAVGDAVGTTLEFKRPGSFEPVTDMVGGGPFNLKPGQWTDDTSMAMCLAESLVHCGGFDPLDQVTRYARYYREGYWSAKGTCFDIGNTVSDAIRRFERTGEPYAGSTDPDTAGNGSIMRLAPIPLFYGDDLEQAVEFAARSSRVTHGAEEAVDACKILTLLIINALNGCPKDEILSEGNPFLQSMSLAFRIDEIRRGSYRRKQPPQIRGTGYVVDSLEAALWAFDSTDTYQDGLLRAVNLGDDADTTGAVYGQLAGAYYGLTGIPAQWLNRLHRRSEIEAMAERLFDKSTSA